MEDGRRFSLSRQLDIGQILLDARTRWLRPSEICEILRNYQKFNLTPEPPYRPPSGSLFLFDRKSLRYFRKDGHHWRKKKDGKTVREAHEKLKSGSVDVLHCYYAHGEDNENFQRRSYWMLDGVLEHIVLVHYRDINEGSTRVMPHLLNSDRETVSHVHGAQSSSAHTQSSEIEEVDSGGYYGGSSSAFHPSYFNQGNLQKVTPNEGHCITSGGLELAGLYGQMGFSQDTIQSGLPEILRKFTNLQQQKISIEPTNYTGSMTMTTMKNFVLGSDKGRDGTLKNLLDMPLYDSMGCGMSNMQVKESYSSNGNRLVRHSTGDSALNTCHVDDDCHSHVIPQFENNEAELGFNASDQSLELLHEASCSKQTVPISNIDNEEHGELKKLDSFGRWMNKEIGRDCDDSLMASDSGSYWNALDTQTDDKEVTSLSRHMQLDTDSLGPSLSQEQLFSILDFSPDWAYSGIETKVLISGRFLGDRDPNSIKWCCMFGKHEVCAEVLTANVLRCQAPAHDPGRVPFYITCSNRLACSEVREFEYRESFYNHMSSASRKRELDEVHLQICFTKMLTQGVAACFLRSCDKCALINGLFSKLKKDYNEWDMIEEQSKAFQEYHDDARDALIQKLLKDKLHDWLVSKVHDEGKGPSVLDGHGLGVIHYASALGYEWAISSIIDAGVNPNFRDSHGRTGLHWAAYYGREEAVVELVRLGAAPGAFEDPTSTSPGGQTAADLASCRGHKGIAGYLAEADLTSHLAKITIEESIMHNVSANLAAEKAVETVQVQSLLPLEREKRELLSLQGSLAAVRNSAQAAARIQAAFRVRSFRQRQSLRSQDASSQILEEVMIASSLNKKLPTISHFDDSLHAAAAVKIQQKFRGWRGRKEFLKIRNRIVKIQAHVRGHQVRKQYKKVVWSVSIVEKAILRWRRKGTGLRGFRVDKPVGSVAFSDGASDDYDFLRLGRKQKAAGVEKALARVQSMARSAEARDQYMRLVASTGRSKLGDGGGSSSAQVQTPEKEPDAEDLLTPMIG